MMKAKRFLLRVIFIGLVLALAGVVRLGLAQGPEPPEGQVQPRGEVSIAATVGSKFSYQGVLKESGSPVTGSRDMTFRLYSDDTCSTQVGSDIVESGVQVTDGLFSVELDVTHSDFNGQGLWLEVEVGGTKIGCQEILPVPYALSLKPEAWVVGEQTGSSVIYVRNTATTGHSTGISGRADSTSGKGVLGYTRATSGITYGVYGSSASPDGYGGYFYGGGTGNYTAIYGYGDVKQNRHGDGLVKAAVYTYCGTCMLCNPERSFNNVTSGSIDCICGANAGQCTIGFGFAISDRFWVATAVDYPNDRGVTCELGSSSDQLDCFHYNASSGAGDDGYIMVLLY